MPGPTNPYIYKPNDNPLSVANQFGVTPQQLISANPGGTPFTTGQTVNIPTVNPYQYTAPIGPQPPASSPPSLTAMGVPQAVAPYTATPFQSAPSRLGVPRGHTQPDFFYGPNVNVGNPNTPYMMGRGGGQTNVLPEGLNYQRQVPGSPTGTPGTLSTGDFYGYERDPETGRSVRVVKNSSTSNFLNELRWDPQSRKYVSIGRLLKQGKLDLKGNWHRQSRRQRQTNNRKQQQQQQRDDFTLSNSMISFSASSG